MIAKLSPSLSKLSDFCWLFLPTLLFFSALFGFYFFSAELIQSWLQNIGWMSFASLAIAAVIAWQFGRSRLVYASLLVLLVALDAQFTLSPALLEARYAGTLLSFVFLLYSKDKGFSILNLCTSLLVISSLFMLCWLGLPLLQSSSQTWLTAFDSLLFQWLPDVRALVSPINAALLLSGFVLGLIRLLVKRDNTHNALFFAMLLCAAMHIYADTELALVIILGLASLICYSVIKDSFTMAFKDELTGIPSRRALMQYVQTLGRKYTVVMSDIDHFKKFNDTYGHDVGDEVLKLVASKLDKVEGGGKTFRFGGEEFIIVFPRKTANEVTPFVEMVRHTIANYDIALRAKPRPPKPKKPAAKKPTRDKVVKVTTSFGVAQRTKDHADFASIMKQADIALYAAKKAGRNCVKVAKQ